MRFHLKYRWPVWSLDIPECHIKSQRTVMNPPIHRQAEIQKRSCTVVIFQTERIEPYKLCSVYADVNKTILHLLTAIIQIWQEIDPAGEPAVPIRRRKQYNRVWFKLGIFVSSFRKSFVELSCRANCKHRIADCDQCSHPCFQRRDSFSARELFAPGRPMTRVYGHVRDV